MKRLCKRLGMMALAGALLLPGMPGVPAGTATVHAATVFPDVTPQTVGEKVQRAIEALAAQGIIRGFPDGTFGPNRAITRAQFAKILAQVQNLEPKPEAAAQFTDISDPEQKGWVGALVAAGLTTGTTPTTFSPNQPIQRDQFATFLVRALGAEEIAKRLNKTPNTKDGARISDAHRANVALLMDLGLMGGFPDGTYGPAQPVKRQQAASVLYDLMQNRSQYVAAVRKYGNDVRIRQLADGTVSVEGYIQGAAEVDVTLTDESNGQTLLQQTVETRGGSFSVQTEQRLLFPTQVRATVTAYDEDGNRLTELAVTAQVGEQPVTGWVQGPDLLQVTVDPKEAQSVRFVFDEPIRRIEDGERFFLVTVDGGKVTPDRVDIDRNDDRVVIARMAHKQLVAMAAIAGVQSGAVADQGQRTNVPYSLPLQDVEMDGTLAGPQLKAVSIPKFSWKKGERFDGQAIRVRFEFDQLLDQDGWKANDAARFGLVLKDGTVLRGASIHEVSASAVTVDFVLDGDEPAPYWHSKRYAVLPAENGSGNGVTFARDLSRDEVVRAFVEAGAVRSREAVFYDRPAPNPFTVLDTGYGALLANELAEASLDAEAGELTLDFKTNLETLLGNEKPYPNNPDGLRTFLDDLSYGITINLATGEHVALRDIALWNTRGERVGDGFVLELHKRRVTIEFREDAAARIAPHGRELPVGQLLPLAAGVAVYLNPRTVSPNPDEWQPYGESEVIAVSTKPLTQEWKAGTAAAPVLQAVQAEYREKEGVLQVRFRFNRRIADANESLFLLYTQDGDWFDGERLVGVERDTAIVEYELTKEEAAAVVLAVAEEGAVTGKGFLHGVRNPVGSLPFKK